MKKYLVPILLAAAGVIVAGVAMKWGYENDVPGLKDAANGFDQ
jgi:hypothetical protein